MHKDLFKFASPRPSQNIVFNSFQTPTKRFWKRFFSKKFNYFVISLFIIVSLIILCFGIFIPYSASNSVNAHTDLVNNLTTTTNPIVTKNFERGDTLNFIYNIENLERLRAKDALTEPVFKILYDSSLLAGGGAKTINTDIVTLQYNPYDLLRAIQLNVDGAKISNYHFILGTNNNGIDIWSRTWYSVLTTILVLVASLVVNIFIGFSLGCYSALKPNSIISKVTDILATIISSIPELIWIVLICALYNSSLISIFVSFCVISWVAFYDLSKSEAEKLRNKEFITASKSIGKNAVQIIYGDIFKNVFSSLLILAIDKISIGILIISSVSFLDFVTNSDIATIGVILKESIQLISQNPWYFVTVTISLSTFAISSKLFANSLSYAYNVKNN